MEKDTIREIYEKEMESYSGLKLLKSDEGSIEYELSNLLEKLLNETHSETLGKNNIRIFWIDCQYINASVVKIEKTYCIGLYSSLTSLFIDHIKTFYDENVLNETDTDVLPRYDRFYKVIPGEGALNKLQNYIFYMSFFYIVMHEFGHILCGHCEGSGSQKFVFEHYDSSRAVTDNYELQAKEYMADFYGIVNCFAAFFPGLFISKNLEDITKMVMLFLTSLNDVNWLLLNTRRSKLSLAESDCSKMTHPHPTTRIGYSIDLIQNELEFHINMFKEEEVILLKTNSYDASERIVNEALKDFFFIIGNTTIDFAAEDLLSEKYENEQKKIQKALIEVKKKYKNLSLVDFN